MSRYTTRCSVPHPLGRRRFAFSIVFSLSLLLLTNWLAIVGASGKIGRLSPAFTPSTQQSDSSQNTGKDAQAVVALELNKPIEREISGGQTHSYQIALTVGQYCEIVVEQRGVDAVVTLLGPDDKLISEFDSEIRKQGQEKITQLAEIPGTYRLTVRPKQKTAPAGQYEIRVAELRSATERDKRLQEARKLYTEAVRLLRSDKYDEAQLLIERVIEIREKLLGSEHANLASALNILAEIYRAKGNYAKAENLQQQVLTIREKAMGVDHPDVARTLNNLALVYTNSGNHSKAIPLFERAVVIIEKSLGPDHPNVPRFLNNIGHAYRKQEELTRAESFYQRALEIGERISEVDQFDLADSIQGLASIASIRGDYLKAEQFYQRALEIFEKEQGPDSLNFARVLDDLAIVYHVKGDYAKAEAGHLRALQIREKMLGMNHPNVAHTLNSLANVYMDKADYVKAEQLHQRALLIREKAFGKEHQYVAESLYNLGIIYRNTGDYTKAEQLNLRALEIFEHRLGPTHSNTAFPLGKLANIYHYQGNYAKAEPLYQRALAIWERVLGPNHPDVATSLNELAMLYAAKGDLTRAVSCNSRANQIGERNIIFNLSTGSERQRLAYLKLLSYENNLTISLHTRFAPNDSAARRLAITNILQRKGRALEATTDSLTSLRRRAAPQDQALLDEFIAARSQLAKLALTAPQNLSEAEHQTQVKALEERIERLEANISNESAEFRAQSKPVTLESVQAAIPANAELIEFGVYRPFNANYNKPNSAFGEPHYSVFRLRVHRCCTRNV